MPDPTPAPTAQPQPPDVGSPDASTPMQASDPNAAAVAQQPTAQPQQAPPDQQASPGQATDAQAQSFQPAQPQNDPKTHDWKNVLSNVMGGLANHLKGAGEGLVTGGVLGAAAGAVNPDFAQKNYDAKRSLQDSKVQQEQMHLATMHANLQEIQRASRVAPQDYQDELNQKAQLFSQSLQQEGNERSDQGFATMQDAENRAAQRMQDNPQDQLSYIPLPSSDGKSFDVWHMLNPKALLKADLHIPMGKDQPDYVIKAGTASQAQAFNIFSTIETNYAKQQAMGQRQTQVAADTGKKDLNVANANKAAADTALTGAKTTTEAKKPGLIDSQINLNDAKAKIAGITNYMMGQTDTGAVIAGTPEALAAAGAKNIHKIAPAEGSKIDIARQLIAPDGLFKKVAGDVDNLEKQGKLGTFASRFQNATAEELGSNPEFKSLATSMGLLTTALMQAHVGNSGRVGMLEHFSKLADYRIEDAATLKAALSSEYKYVREKAALIPPPAAAPGATK
jgi:hypothetical protein